MVPTRAAVPPQQLLQQHSPSQPLRAPKNPSKPAQLQQAGLWARQDVPFGVGKHPVTAAVKFIPCHLQQGTWGEPGFGSPVPSSQPLLLTRINKLKDKERGHGPCKKQDLVWLSG